MRQELSLDGAWRLTGMSPDEGADPLHLDAQVPGQVHLDLAGTRQLTIVNGGIESRLVLGLSTAP